jgi:hypothetical protein
MVPIGLLQGLYDLFIAVVVISASLFILIMLLIFVLLRRRYMTAGVQFVFWTLIATLVFCITIEVIFAYNWFGPY